MQANCGLHSSLQFLVVRIEMATQAFGYVVSTSLNAQDNAVISPIIFLSNGVGLLTIAHVIALLQATDA